jgi:hypothetical protein
LEKSGVEESRVKEESMLLAILAMIDEMWGIYTGEWLGAMLGQHSSFWLLMPLL